MSIPQTPATKLETEPSEVDMSEMQVIGHDDNVRTQSLEEPTKPPILPPKVRSWYILKLNHSKQKSFKENNQLLMLGLTCKKFKPEHVQGFMVTFDIG